MIDGLRVMDSHTSSTADCMQTINVSSFDPTPSHSYQNTFRGLKQPLKCIDDLKTMSGPDIYRSIFESEDLGPNQVDQETLI